MINNKQYYRNLSKNETKIHINFDKKIIISNKIKTPKNVIKLIYPRISNIIYKININNFISLNICNDKIKDVSALGNVHILYLSGTNIKDVSALGNVHTLDLSYCKNITFNIILRKNISYYLNKFGLSNFISYINGIC
jgi:hypothetical protein